MTLKVYVDRISQPARAVLIFCKVNGIEFEEITVSLVKKEHKLPAFKEINPFGQVPSIADGDFKLFESHAILSYLACGSPGVADHWYPSDLKKRAKINSVLDWHHSNLRRGGVGFVLYTTVGPALGIPSNPDAAAECEKVLISSLSKIESVWLNENGDFLLGNKEPSIADISLVCEIMEFELLLDEDRIRVLSPFKKVLKWIEATRTATSPHFEEVHQQLIASKPYFLPVGDNYEPVSSIKAMLVDMDTAAAEL